MVQSVNSCSLESPCKTTAQADLIDCSAQLFTTYSYLRNIASRERWMAKSPCPLALSLQLRAYTADTIAGDAGGLTVDDLKIFKVHVQAKKT